MAPLLIVVIVDATGLGVILPLLPFYSEHFGASPVLIGALVSTFSLCQFVAAPWLGKLSDRFGRKPVLIASQAGTALSLLMLGLANSLAMVFIARMLDGLSSGNISVAAAYAVDNSAAATRKRAIGVVSAGIGIGLMTGPALSGLLSRLSIPAPVWGAFLTSLLSVLASCVLLPGNTRPAPHGPGAPRGRSLAQLMTMPGTFPVLALLALFYLAFGMYTSQLPLFMSARFQWNGLAFGPREVGIAFACAGAINVSVQLFGMKLAERWLGDRQLAILGFLLIGAGYCCLGLAASVTILAVALVSASLGTSLLRPTLTSTLSLTADRQQQGALMGINQSIMAISNIIGPLLAGMLIGHSLYSGWAFCAAALIGAGLLGAFWMIVRQRWPVAAPDAMVRG